MAVKIERPAVVQAAGTKPKRIEEFFGLVNSRTGHVSIARMESPSGWVEPGQTPEFDEYTVVLRGLLRVETKTAVYDVRAGEAIETTRGEWVRYNTGTRRRRVPRGVRAGVFSSHRASRFVKPASTAKALTSGLFEISN